MTSKTFEVTATIKQTITADNTQNAFKRAYSLIDIDGAVSVSVALTLSGV